MKRDFNYIFIELYYSKKYKTGVFHLLLHLPLLIIIVVIIITTHYDKLLHKNAPGSVPVHTSHEGSPPGTLIPQTETCTLS